jgi:hypothetical protein
MRDLLNILIRHEGFRVTEVLTVVLCGLGVNNHLGSPGPIPRVFYYPTATHHTSTPPGLQQASRSPKLHAHPRPYACSAPPDLLASMPPRLHTSTTSSTSSKQSLPSTASSIQSKIFFLAKSQQEIDPPFLGKASLFRPCPAKPFSSTIIRWTLAFFNTSPSHRFSSLLSRPLCSRSPHLSFLPSAEALS